MFLYFSRIYFKLRSYMRSGRSAISKIGLLRTGCRAAFRGVLMKNALELCDSADILGVSTIFHLCQADSEDSRAPFMDNLTHAPKLIS